MYEFNILNIINLKIKNINNAIQFLLIDHWKERFVDLSILTIKPAMSFDYYAKVIAASQDESMIDVDVIF